MSAGRIYGYRVDPRQRDEIAGWTPPGEEAVDALPAPLAKPAGYREDEEEVEEAAPPSGPSLPPGIGEDSTHAFIFRHARQAAAVLRSIARRNEGGGEGPLSGLSAPQVVAAFMIALGREVGAAVLRHLEGDELEYLARAVVQQGEITHAAAMHALERVRQEMVAGNYLEVGGAGYARTLLDEVVGARRAEHILNRARHAQTSGFELLERVRPEQLAPFLVREHPQSVALILSQLKPELSSDILSQLPEPVQLDVSYRIAAMGEVARATLERLEETLKQSLRELLGTGVKAGGPKVLADVLSMRAPGLEKKVLEQMNTIDPEMAEMVRNTRFVFADIARLTDREIQELLREVDQKDLVMGLKGAGDELKEKILGNMSEKVRTFIQEEMEFLGPMRLSEVEEVQWRIVQQVRQLEEQGKLSTGRAATEEVFV